MGRGERERGREPSVTYEGRERRALELKGRAHRGIQSMNDVGYLKFWRRKIYMNIGVL